MREALASALDARGFIEGARVLDLYAGTGALAFEALSRGAHSAVLVEKNRRVARAIEKSAAELGLKRQARVVIADLARPEGRWQTELRDTFDLVLIDPPYAHLAEVPPLLAQLGPRSFAPDAAVVVEHAKRDAPPSLPFGFREISRYRYGDTAVLLAQYSPPALEDA